MRVLIFNWRDLKHSWAGGGEIYVFEQAKRWVKKGHKVTVFCSNDPYSKLKDKEEYKGIKIIRRGNRFSVYFWAPIYYLKYFRKSTDVVVDVENGIPFLTPLFSRKPKVCFVYHVHGRQFFYELPQPLSSIGFFIESFLFPLVYRFTKIVAISKTTKNDLVNLGFNPKRIEIVYCGIDKPEGLEKKVKKFYAPTLLYLGRIKAYKRVELLVEIFREVLKKKPGAKLIIAGWGTEASGLIDSVMRGKSRRRIHIVGPVTETEKRMLLSRSWLFVNPSIGEGWSIAVIESNIHGTPAVAFNVSGLSESIIDGKTGVLAKDREDLVEKILEIINNRKLRDDLSKQARTWAEQFSWDKAASQTLKILEAQMK